MPWEKPQVYEQSVLSAVKGDPLRCLGLWTASLIGGVWERNVERGHQNISSSRKVSEAAMWREVWWGDLGGREMNWACCLNFSWVRMKRWTEARMVAVRRLGQTWQHLWRYKHNTACQLTVQGVVERETFGCTLPLLRRQCKMSYKI